MIPEPPVDPPEPRVPAPLPYRLSPAHRCPRWCNPNDPCASCEERINMRSKHSPAPWVWTNGEVPVDVATYDAPGYYQNIILQDADGKSVAGCDEYDTVFGRDDSQRVANAHLIAAAPELLAALREMTEAFAVAGTNPGRRFALDIALDAIRKATS